MSALSLVKLLDPIQLINILGGLVPMGAYDNATDYAVGDAVSYNGKSYVMYVDAGAGTLPTDDTKWMLLADQGPQGDPGEGVPVGGTTGQLLAKNSATNYDTEWIDPPTDQTYDEYIYNSSGAQSGNRYNDWGDLYTAFNTGQDGPIRITFEQNETLPPGTYNLDDITLRGNGTPALVGGLVVTTTDVVISSWDNARIEGGLGLGTAGSVPTITVSSSFTIEFGGGSVIFGAGTQPFFKMVGAGVLIALLGTGSGLYNFGGEPFEMVSTAEVTIFANEPSVLLPDDIFKGTTTGSRLKIIVGSSASQVDTARSDANLSGGTASIELAEMADLVKFDNSTNGFTATNVQDAIEAVVPYTGATTDVNLGTRQLTVHNIRPDASDGLLIESNSGADIALLGAGGGQNATFYDGVKLDGSTASRILSTDASKNITALDTAIYPSLTELSYMKGITSAVQTQIDGKISASSTNTLTNKRITKRVTTITSNATPTINTDNCDAVNITALAAAITSMTTNLSGTPSNFDQLIFRIKDDGTARAITWGASFEAKGVALPTTTVLSKVLTVGFIYDTVTSKWGCVASATEA